MPGSILGTRPPGRGPELLLGPATSSTTSGSTASPTRSSCAARSPTPGSPAIDTSEAARRAGRAGRLHRRRPGPRTGLRLRRRQRPGRRAAALAVDKVRYVGDPVALVVAETRAQAVDAAELVDVDYDDLPVVADMEAALADDAPLQFEAIGTNIADPARGQATTPTRSTAPTTWSGVRMVNQRIATAPIEGNAILVAARRTTGMRRPGSPPSTRTWPATCSPRPSASTEADVRVVAPHVGGAFGGKAGIGHRPRRDRRSRPAGSAGRSSGPRPAARRCSRCRAAARCSTPSSG